MKGWRYSGLNIFHCNLFLFVWIQQKSVAQTSLECLETPPLNGHPDLLALVPVVDCDFFGASQELAILDDPNAPNIQVFEFTRCIYRGDTIRSDYDVTCTGLGGNRFSVTYTSDCTYSATEDNDQGLAPNVSRGRLIQEFTEMNFCLPTVCTPMDAQFYRDAFSGGETGRSQTIINSRGIVTTCNSYEGDYRGTLPPRPTSVTSSAPSPAATPSSSNYPTPVLTSQPTDTVEFEPTAQSTFYPTALDLASLKPSASEEQQATSSGSSSILLAWTILHVTFFVVATSSFAF